MSVDSAWRLLISIVWNCDILKKHSERIVGHFLCSDNQTKVAMFGVYVHLGFDISHNVAYVRN